MAGKSRTNIVVYFLFTNLIYLTISVSGVRSDDVDIVYQRIYDSALDKANKQDYHIILDLLQADGSFSDLKYGQDASESFMTHGKRQAALLYHHLQGEANLTQEAELCFKYLTYDAPPNTDDNWWGHVIGTPKKMWAGVVLANGILDRQIILDFLDRYWVNTQAGPVWISEEVADGSFAGGNFAPRALLGEVEGHIRGTYKTVHQEVSQKLYKEVALRQPFDGNGIRPDGCLHQHNPKGDHVTEGGFYLNHTLWNPYSGEYGKVFLENAALMMTWYSRTDLDYEDETIEGLYSTYLECQQWIFRGKVIEPTLAGRKIPSGKMITGESGEHLILETGQYLQQMGRHQQEVEAVLHRYNNVVPDPEYALVGHRHFFNTDLSVQQRRDYFASVRILSNRTVRPETWLSGENIEGFFQADGFMTVLVDGKEYGKKNNEVFQVYDWARIPSVTNQYTDSIPKYQMNAVQSRHFFNDAKFSGGVTDGLIGVASMVYNRPYVPLQALKSWFFFDDVIVVVGSGITMNPEYVTHKYVGSTLTQIVFAGDYIVCTKTGEEESLGMGVSDHYHPSWIFHRNVSYVFLNDDEHLHSSAETREHGDKELDVFTSWLTHKSDPVNATLAYAVLPATNLEATREFANNPTVEIIDQETDKHVVCHHLSSSIGASLVAGGIASVTTCGGLGPLDIEVDTPCLLLATIEKSSDIEARITLSIADPQQTFDVINVMITFEGRQVEKTVNLPQDPLRGSTETTIITI